MLPDSLVGGLKGKVEAEVSSQATLKLDSVAEQINDLLFVHSRFSINLADFSLDMPDSMMCVQNLSGHMKYKNDTVWIDQLNGKYLGLQVGADATTISSVYTAAIHRITSYNVCYTKLLRAWFDWGWKKEEEAKSQANADSIYATYQKIFHKILPERIFALTSRW